MNKNFHQPQMNTDGTIVLGTIGVHRRSPAAGTVFALAGVILLAAAGYIAHSRRQIVTTWPLTQAAVERCQVIRSHSTSGHLVFQPRVRFRYFDFDRPLEFYFVSLVTGGLAIVFAVAGLLVLRLAFPRPEVRCASCDQTGAQGHLYCIEFLTPCLSYAGGRSLLRAGL